MPLIHQNKKKKKNSWTTWGRLLKLFWLQSLDSRNLWVVVLTIRYHRGGWSWFIASDLTVENTAMPEAQSAVALENTVI